jgi:hypothetical protein
VDVRLESWPFQGADVRLESWPFQGVDVRLESRPFQGVDVRLESWPFQGADVRLESLTYGTVGLLDGREERVAVATRWQNGQSVRVMWTVLSFP